MKTARLLAGARITEHVMRALFLWSIPTANGIIECGVILGTLFGWLGAYVAFGLYADKTMLPFDWDTNGILLSVAAIAALPASVFPARRVVRTPSGESAYRSLMTRRTSRMMVPAMPAHGAAGIVGALPFRQVAASITVVTIANRAFGKTARNVIEDDVSQGVRPGYIFVGRFGTF